jgi:hypothetical protein
VALEALRWSQSNRRWVKSMPRPRQRVCLQHGLTLDLNKLAHQDLVKPGTSVGPHFIRWFSTYWEEEIAHGLISASMEGGYESWLRIQIGNLDQWIILVDASRRHTFLQSPNLEATSCLRVAVC